MNRWETGRLAVVWVIALALAFVVCVGVISWAQQSETPASPTIQWSTSNVMQFSDWQYSCQITISPAGKVTLERCKDADEAARTFWKAVEHNFPCKGAQ